MDKTFAPQMASGTRYDKLVRPAQCARFAKPDASIINSGLMNHSCAPGKRLRRVIRRVAFTAKCQIKVNHYRFLQNANKVSLNPFGCEQLTLKDAIGSTPAHKHKTIGKAGKWERLPYDQKTEMLSRHNPLPVGFLLTQLVHVAGLIWRSGTMEIRPRY